MRYQVGVGIIKLFSGKPNLIKKHDGINFIIICVLVGTVL